MSEWHYALRLKKCRQESAMTCNAMVRPKIFNKLAPTATNGFHNIATTRVMPSCRPVGNLATKLKAFPTEI